MSETLFKKYGGFDTINTLVQTFYGKVLQSDNLTPFFKDIDMDKLMDHQTRFISQVLGGPVHFKEDVLFKAHQHLNIKEEDFLEVAEYLKETLEEAGVEDGDISIIMGIVTSTKEQILH